MTPMLKGAIQELKRAVRVKDGNYGSINPMKDYLYLRVSQKQSFDILCFTPGINGIMNFNDRSMSISPELLE
jgi:hypothetical protein